MLFSSLKKVKALTEILSHVIFKYPGNAHSQYLLILTKILHDPFIHVTLDMHSSNCILQRQILHLTNIFMNKCLKQNILFSPL